MEQKIHGTFYFDPTDRIYESHFPGRPVVPGSVIVKAFVEAAKSGGVLQDPVVVTNFRFRKFVSPGEHTYCLTVRPAKIQCRLLADRSRGSEILVTGLLER